MVGRKLAGWQWTSRESPDWRYGLGLDQLAEGGRLAAVVDKGTGPGCAMLFLKKDGLISKRTLFDANIPGLPEFKNQPGFVF